MTRRFIFTSYFFKTLASSEPAGTAKHRGSLQAQVMLWFVDLSRVDIMPQWQSQQRTSRAICFDTM
jgi:hypothetical protein